MENQKGANRSDEELIVAIQSGSKKAFQQLYHSHCTVIYYNLKNFCKDHSLIEQVMEQIFVQIWTKRMDLDPKQEFRPFMFRLARRLIMRSVRMSRVHFLCDNLEDVAREVCDEPLEGKVSEDEERVLMDAINKLPKQLMVVFKLCKLEGRRDEEVTKLLGLSQQELESHLRQGLRMLRSFIVGTAGGLLSFLLVPMFYESVCRLMFQIV